MFQGGGFGTGTSSTFGSFNKPATSFGSTQPVFGSSGGSLFGSTPQPSSGGLFGSSTAAPAFGQPQTTTPSFGGFSSNTGTGLFGSNQNASTSSGLFGSTTTSAFGQAKPAFGGFGTTQTSSLFGQQPTAQTQPQSTNIFGQTPGTSSTGLFGSSGGFGSTLGATANQGTGAVKFVAVTGTDSMVKNGVSQTISTRHHCITCMKEYEGKSLEELRLEDYAANRKGPQQGVQPSGGLFGSTPQPSLFGAGASNTTGTGTGLFGATENKPLFGNTNTSIGFGQTSNVFGNTGNSLFGKPTTATPAFGTPTTTTSSFAFNSTPNSNPFGSNMAQVKPFGTSQPLFGTATSQPNTGFGSQTPGFGSTFGQPATQSTSLFGQQPAKPAFGTATTPFSFGQSSTTTAGTSLFGAKPTNTFGSPFGSTATTNTGFGTTTTGFGATNQNTSLFGNNTFKPPASNFSFNPTPTSNSTLGGGSSLFGNNANKPSLFGSTNTGTGLFGSSGFGSNTNTSFGNNTNTGLGMSMPMGSLLGGSTFTSSNASQQAANPLNQHILALASMPFGDNPLFKNLLPTTGKTEELLKPAPGATQKNLLNGNNFKVSTTNTAKIKMKPIGTSTLTKVSLFEGLEDDPNYFQKMQMKPTIKRLVISGRGPRSPKSPMEPTGPASPFLPLENLTADKTSPRFFTPLDSVTSSPAADTTKLSSSQNEPSSPTAAKASSKDEGSNTVLMTTVAQSPEPENTMLELGGKLVASPTTTTSATNTTLDNKENQEQSSSSTSSDSDTCELVSDAPSPTGITLRRVGYYTIPSMEQLANLLDEEGHCVVDNFTVGRYNYGNIFFPDSFDVSGLNLDDIVHFRHKEVTVYPDESKKPPLGEGLNRAAQVTLDRVWPLDKVKREPISDPAALEELDYEATLRHACAKMGARFKEYRSQTGSWVFKVDHFSKYGLSDSDEDEEPVSDIKKLRLSSAPPQVFPPGPKDLGLKRGLDGAWIPPPQSTPAASLLGLDEDDEDMNDDLIKTPFDLDDNYQPTQLSPSMQLARQMGASAQKVQLMKASFFPDEVDEFPINGDFIDYRMGAMLDVEELDQGTKLFKSFPLFRTQFSKYEETPPLPFQPVGVEREMSPVPSAEIEMPAATPVPTVKPQHRALTLPDSGVVCYSRSLAARPDVAARCAVDLALFKGRSFRVGWAKDGVLASLSTHKVARTVDWSMPMDQLATVLEGRQDGDTSPSIVQRIRILPGHDEASNVSFQSSIEEHLEIALEHSLWSEGEECPRAAPKAGVAALHAHCDQALHSPPHGPALQVWQLCVALWGDLPDLDPHELPTSHHAVMVRRQAVSDWLETVVTEKVRGELAQDTTNTAANVFSLLTGHCVLEACNQANIIGDAYTSLLLAQLGGCSSVKVMMEQQLTQWVDTEADKLIDKDRLKLMMLAAGRPILHASDKLINICENLDWKRAFALHLWYICSPVASVTDALLRYEAAFSDDDDDPYACPPLPSHLGDLEWESTGGQTVYDVCYHLLKLYSSRAHPLAPLLNPATHSADPLDNRLSWLLLRTVEALGYNHVSAVSAANIHTGFAAQLEAHGLWHWAVFVLQHLADPNGRRKAVLDVLGRHISLSQDEDAAKVESFLINQLHIPRQWVYQVKAIKASSHFQHKEAAMFLLEAEQWNEAHKVIIQHISAKAIINDKYQYLEGLLKRLAPHSKVISNWSHEGSLLLDYLSMVHQVSLLMTQHRDNTIGYHLERLQPLFTSLCTRIPQLPTPTAIHRLCQVEIAKRAVSLIRTVLILQKGSNAQTMDMSMSVLATLVHQLPLPEDYSKQELQEIITSLLGTITR
ncbi:nuclear pore complex protein Nup98-Nup96 isoform X2 [Macrosteles quadrilineatus]|uniref:nuclear pore complex protein Nup98-Nup96 isoform X2 n=1 Tax=Macrosteles quadrilineatus TaxID=74068 RepID=UPI0023E33C6E|nr:nuclear pore complex protein Nup98-Nup96 isoform X2 [Macrosteles quadrilineatus]